MPSTSAARPTGWQFGLPAAHQWYDRAYCRCWDLLHRVHTCGDIHPRNLDMPAELREYSAYYMPTHPKHIRLLLRTLPLAKGRYTLVDYGSGKGRVILSAMSFPFRSIVGIEAAPQLHRLAEENIRSYRGRQACSNVRSVCMDVRDHQVEPTESVYYFFSPFTEPIMRPVLENIFHSLREHPRDAFLVYVNPELRSIIDGSGLFRIFGQGKYSTVWRFTEGT
jgi:hypothetical protein